MALRLTLAPEPATNKIIVCCGFWPADQTDYLKSFETDPLLNFLVSNDFTVYSAQTLEQAKTMTHQHKPATLLINIDPFDKLKIRQFLFPLLWITTRKQTLLTIFTKHSSPQIRISWYHWGVAHVFDPSVPPEELIARCEALHKMMN